jgi:hypothetical protein
MNNINRVGGFSHEPPTRKKLRWTPEANRASLRIDRLHSAADKWHC